MTYQDAEILLQAIEAQKFIPITDREKHVMGMARQSVMFKRDLRYPESMELQGIYRRVYA